MADCKITINLKAVSEYSTYATPLSPEFASEIFEGCIRTLERLGKMASYIEAVIVRKAERQNKGGGGSGYLLETKVHMVEPITRNERSKFEVECFIPIRRTNSIDCYADHDIERYVIASIQREVRRRIEIREEISPMWPDLLKEIE